LQQLVVNKCKFCVVFVEPTSHFCLDSDSSSDDSNDECNAPVNQLKNIKLTINALKNNIKGTNNVKYFCDNDEDFDKRFIVAWDMLWGEKEKVPKKINKKLLSCFALIIAEQIIDMPVDKKYMTEGNIFVMREGIVTYSKMTLNDVMQVYRTVH
jgi:hypothetical protein